jgi:hypothetical protein
LTIQFPQYRKYLNGQSYFKIISAEEMTELKIIGSLYEVHHLKVKILPDRNLLHDLLNDYAAFAEAIDEMEFEDKLQYCKLHLQKLSF